MEANNESKEIGKPTGNDMLEGKLTLPALYALNSTRDKQAQEIAAKVKSGTATTDEIARLIEFSKANGGIEYATKVMIEFKEKALIYYTIVKEVLGEEWLNNGLFRLGTSRLANLLLSEIKGEEMKFF